VAVDCPNIPESLWESEMFGYEKGAFSGAQARRAGRIEHADKGTLFLDEIGELPLAMQPKLLRVLETGSVSRLGGGNSVKVDVRLVAATNRDLATEVAAGRFRSDLFARVAHALVALPPLRDRRCDVPLLLARFLGERGIDEALPVTDLERLMLHPWPLNVRELASLAELLVASVRSEGGKLRLGPAALARLETYARSAPDSGQQSAGGGRRIPGSPPDVPTRSVRDGPRGVGKAGGAKGAAAERPGGEVTRDSLDRLLREYDGNVTTVAEKLGKHRFQLYRLLARFGLDPEKYR